MEPSAINGDSGLMFSAVDADINLANVNLDSGNNIMTHSTSEGTNLINIAGSNNNNNNGTSKRQHRDSDTSDGLDRLMVYDDEAHSQRKSSISFDKIKQISLTYSLQSEDDIHEGGHSANRQPAQEKKGSQVEDGRHKSLETGADYSLWQRTAIDNGAGSVVGANEYKQQEEYKTDSKDGDVHLSQQRKRQQELDPGSRARQASGKRVTSEPHRDEVEGRNHQELTNPFLVGYNEVEVDVEDDDYDDGYELDVDPDDYYYDYNPGIPIDGHKQLNFDDSFGDGEIYYRSQYYRGPDERSTAGSRSNASDAGRFAELQAGVNYLAGRQRLAASEGLGAASPTRRRLEINSNQFEPIGSRRRSRAPLKQLAGGLQMSHLEPDDDGANSGLRVRRHDDDSISVVLFNGTDANIIIRDNDQVDAVADELDDHLECSSIDDLNGVDGRLDLALEQEAATAGSYASEQHPTVNGQGGRPVEQQQQRRRRRRQASGLSDYPSSNERLDEQMLQARDGGAQLALNLADRDENIGFAKFTASSGEGAGAGGSKQQQLDHHLNQGGAITIAEANEFGHNGYNSGGYAANNAARDRYERLGPARPDGPAQATSGAHRVPQEASGFDRAGLVVSSALAANQPPLGLQGGGGGSANQGRKNNYAKHNQEQPFGVAKSSRRQLAAASCERAAGETVQNKSPTRHRRSNEASKAPWRGTGNNEEFLSSTRLAADLNSMDQDANNGANLNGQHSLGRHTAPGYLFHEARPTSFGRQRPQYGRSSQAVFANQSTYTTSNRALSGRLIQMANPGMQFAAGARPSQLFSSQDQIDQVSAGSSNWLPLDADEEDYYRARSSPMQRWRPMEEQSRPRQVASSLDRRGQVAEPRRVDIVISSPQRYAKSRRPRYAADNSSGLQQFWASAGRQARDASPSLGLYRAGQGHPAGRVRYLWPQQQRVDAMPASRGRFGGQMNGQQQQHSSPSSAGSHSGWSSNYGYTINDQSGAPSNRSRSLGPTGSHSDRAATNQGSGGGEPQPAYCSNASSEPDGAAPTCAKPARQASPVKVIERLASDAAAEPASKLAANAELSSAVSGDKQPVVASGKATLMAAEPKQQPQQQHQASFASPTSGCPLFAAAPAAPNSTQINRPAKLKNLLNGEQMVDNLNTKYKHNSKSHGCNETRCLASLINAKPVEFKVRPVNETLEHAKDFINNFYASIKRLDSPAHKTRLQEIEQQLRSTDTYYLKETELIYGAKLAWRNASRCIGRIQWSKLQVFDARFTTNANEMFEALCNHIKYATNKGSLRSAITILPQRVKSTDHDWRIWNSQLIGYAGYRNKETGQVVGDPSNADFTECCQKLGWQGKGTRFDVLPIVLSANGGPPQLFPLPEDLVLRVGIKHPKYKWFEELGLEWYALPAVANMMLDVGGLQFTAAPFSGWYMVTEIGTRDLGDANRYNVLEEIAQRLGLNTRSNMSLWKDQAVVELNIAVLDSFQSAGVTIVDHHTASETFMTHLANEQRLRGGCPADWVWLVPPTSGSTTQVFHQEMVNYHLLPNYEYMDPVWKNFDWLSWEKKQKEKIDQLACLKQQRGAGVSPLATCGLQLSPSGRVVGSNGELTPRKLRFKEIARAVKFTSKLFGKALSRRIKATILYATETGKSERFANKLAQTFSCAFNVHLMSMSDYDMTCLEHEALLLIVTSTFGNGDPPENGELFAKHLAAVKLTGDTSPDLDSINSVSTNPFFQMISGNNSAAAISDTFNNKDCSNSADEKDWDPESDLLNEQRDKQEQQTNVRPLSNVRFGVFALGSTAYPHFCAFGRYIDQTLGELGAERILKCTCGDELCGQEKAFNGWSNQVFKTACDVFCLTDSIGPIEERAEIRWTPEDVKFVPVELVAESDVDSNNNDKTASPSNNSKSGQTASTDVLTSKKVILRNLMNITNKRIIPLTVKNRLDLHYFNVEENRQTIRIDLESNWISPISSSGVSATNTTSASIMSQASINGQSNKQSSLVPFEAGDHIAIYPVNKLDMVDKILNRMANDLARQSGSLDVNNGGNGNQNKANDDGLVKRENMDLTPATSMGTQNGEDNWINHDRLPVTSIREALTRYLDITSPPNQEFLSILARQTSDSEERKRLQQMAKNFTIYEAWKNNKVPDLLDVLQEFKTIKFDPALVTQIPLMKPRFYSVSGTSISLTVGVVRYRTNSGDLKEGLCSNYLNIVPMSSQTYVYGYVRSAPAFHMPQDKSIPMILISAGTGIAPFRSFWQQRYADMQKSNSQKSQQIQPSTVKSDFGRIEMYFGCRNSNYILYKDELDEMYENGVLSSINIAFSRPADCDVFEENVSTNQTNISLPNHPPLKQSSNSKVASIRQARKRMYVQDKLLEDSDTIYRLIMLDGAHVYVCGDVAMADGVYKTLANIFNNSFKANKLSEKCDPSSADSAIDSGLSGDLARSTDDGESVLMNLRNLNRYHEDIFGAKQMS